MIRIKNDFFNEYNSYIKSLEDLLIKNNVLSADEIDSVRSKYAKKYNYEKYKNDELNYLNHYSNYLNKKVSSNDLRN